MVVVPDFNIVAPSLVIVIFIFDGSPTDCNILSIPLGPNVVYGSGDDNDDGVDSDGGNRGGDNNDDNDDNNGNDDDDDDDDDDDHDDDHVHHD